MQSLGVVFIGPNEVQIQKTPVPEPGPSEVLIETHRTLISTGTECIVLGQRFSPGTHWSNWVRYPFFPGYSNVGVVLAVGDAVQSLSVGQRVFSRGKHQHYFVSLADRCVPVPESVADEEAVFAAIAKIVQQGFRKAQLELGQTVVVVGQGLLGQLMTQYAQLAGAGEVIAIDPAAGRLEMSQRHGATLTLPLGAAEAIDAVRDRTAGRMADVVFEMTGHAAVLAPSLKLLRRFGKLVLVGDTGNPEQQHISTDLLRYDLQILGAHDAGNPPEATPWTPWDARRMIELFFTYLERKQMHVAELVTHRFDVRQADDAYRLLNTTREQAMGVLFDFRALPGHSAAGKGDATVAGCH